MTQETKLGIFVLIGITGLVLSIFLLGDFQFQSTYNLNILFGNVAGLPQKAKVKIAGVEVGGVKQITLRGNKANVKIWLKSGIKIHKDAEASIVSTGIIGSKYLELTIGSETESVLKNGEEINGIEPVSFEKMAQDVVDQLDRLVGSFKGPTGEDIGKNLSASLSNIRQITDSLRAAIADQEEKVVDIVDSLHSFSRDIAQITAENRDNLKSAIKNISEVAQKLDNVLSKIEGGEGTLGKLVSDKKMGDDIQSTFTDLKETTQEAKRVLKRINLIETDWDYRLRYDGKYDVARHDVGLKISPKPGKYYYVGVSNAGEVRTDMSYDPEKMNTINFLLGAEFKQGQAYAGVIRNGGGIGAKIKPLWKWEPWRRLEMTAEGYSFFRKTPVAKPKYNIGARFEITRWAYLGAQLEDPYYESSMNTYVNVVLRDDDIAYVLGLVGLAGQ